MEGAGYFSCSNSSRGVGSPEEENFVKSVVHKASGSFTEQILHYEEDYPEDQFDVQTNYFDEVESELAPAVEETYLSKNSQRKRTLSNGSENDAPLPQRTQGKAVYRKLQKLHSCEKPATSIGAGLDSIGEESSIQPTLSELDSSSVPEPMFPLSYLSPITQPIIEPYMEPSTEPASTEKMSKQKWQEILKQLGTSSSCKTRAKWWWLLQAEKTKLDSTNEPSQHSPSGIPVQSGEGSNNSRLPPRSRLRDLLDWVSNDSSPTTRPKGRTYPEH